MHATPTSDMNGPDEAAVARHVDAGLLALAYRTISIAAPIQCLGAALLVLVEWRAGMAFLLSAWLALVLLLNGLRCVDQRRFLRTVPADADAEHTRRWRRRFLAGPLATGLAWGCAAALVFVTTTPARECLVLILFLGGVSTAAYTLAPVRGAFERYSLPMLLPLVVAAVVGPNRDPALAALAVGYWAVLYVMAGRLRAASVAALAFGARNDALLAAASRANVLLAERNAALLASEDRFRELSRLSSDWLWQQDASHRFEKIDGEVQLGRRYIGSNVGKRRWDIPYIEPAQGTWDDHRLALERREPFKDFLVRWHASDGAVHYVSVSGRPRFDAQGAFTGYIGTTKDVTEIKRAEETAAAARAEAEAANAAKSHFLANVTHELRTPMNGVLGTLDLLADSSLDDEQRRLLGIAVASGQSLLELIDEILEFSRLDGPERVALEMQPFAARELVETLQTRHLARARAKGLELSSEVAADVPARLIGDPVRISRIATILVGNAIKFTERGGVRIALRAEALALNPQRVRLRLSVADSGVGIDPLQRARLFLPFSQGDETMSRRHGGTGLGLAIARRLTMSMEGAIDVESESGKGSVFTVVIPLARAADAPPALTYPMPIAGAAPEAPVTNAPRVLLVEDNPVNREVALAMLARLGARTSVATDGLEAIAAVRAGRFDLILMDCQMPGMDGYAATSAIRALERAAGSARTPIVALTANTLDADRDRCLAAGMDDHLGKPFKRAAIAAKLRQWTGGGHEPPA